MKYILILLAIGIIMGFSCESDIKGKHNFSEILNLIELEKIHFSKNNLNSFNLKKSYQQLDIYRATLIDYMKRKDIIFDFDSAFYIEYFDIYKEEKDSYYYPEQNYMSILFIMKGKKETFFVIEISNDLKQINIRKVTNPLFKGKKELVKWLSKPAEFERLNKTNRFVNFEVENYLIISKYKQNEKFCRIEFNPMWSLMTLKDNNAGQLKTAEELGRIAYLYILTGNGSPF